MWLTAGKDNVLREWTINSPSQADADKNKDEGSTQNKYSSMAEKNKKPERIMSLSKRIKQMSQVNSLNRQ